MNDSRHKVTVILTAIGIYLCAYYSGQLLFHFEAYASFCDELPRVLGYLERPVRWFLFCVIGIYIVHRKSPWKALDELGLIAPVGRAAVFGLVATSPMWLPSLFIGNWATSFDPVYVLYGSLVWPLGEELLFRGYVFRQLYRYGGWNIWLAGAFAGVLFSLPHLSLPSASDFSVLNQLTLVAIQVLLSMLGAWVFVKWDDNLWILVSLHGFMNFWWDVFDMADNPLGDWVPNVARLCTAVLGILLTLYRRPIEEKLANRRRLQQKSA